MTNENSKNYQTMIKSKIAFDILEIIRNCLFKKTKYLSLSCYAYVFNIKHWYDMSRK